MEIQFLTIICFCFGSAFTNIEQQYLTYLKRYLLRTQSTYNRLYGKPANGMLLRFFNPNQMIASQGAVQGPQIVNNVFPVNPYEETGFKAPPRSQQRPLNPAWSNMQVVQNSKGNSKQAPKKKMTTYMNPKGTSIQINDLEEYFPQEKVTLSPVSSSEKGLNVVEDLGQYFQEKDTNTNKNAGNTGGLFDATGKISVRSSGGVPMKPQETTKKPVNPNPIQDQITLWNPSMTNRYSNLTNLTQQDLNNGISKLILEDPSLFRKYSNSKGMNVIVSEGIEKFLPIFSQNLVTVSPLVDYKNYEVNLNYQP